MRTTIAIAISLLIPSLLHAAPLRPLGPADISGTISAVEWISDRHVTGAPGMSGTLGKDRLVKAHFIVTLSPFGGVDDRTAIAMTRYVDWKTGEGEGKKEKPSIIMLLINHPDRNFLRKGMRIRVEGYGIAGDEGGTWSKFRKIEILPGR